MSFTVRRARDAFGHRRLRFIGMCNEESSVSWVRIRVVGSAKAMYVRKPTVQRDDEFRKKVAKGIVDSSEEDMVATTKVAEIMNDGLERSEQDKSSDRVRADTDRKKS